MPALHPEENKANLPAGGGVARAEPAPAHAGDAGGTHGRDGRAAHGRDAHATGLRQRNQISRRAGYPTIAVCHRSRVPAAGFPRQTNPICGAAPVEGKCGSSTELGEKCRPCRRQKQSRFPPGGRLAGTPAEPALRAGLSPLALPPQGQACPRAGGERQGRGMPVGLTAGTAVLLMGGTPMLRNCAERSQWAAGYLGNEANSRAGRTP